jgi:hypothetical protein
MGRGVLTGNASGDDDNVGAGERLLEAVILGEVAGDFLFNVSIPLRVVLLASHTAGLEMWDRSVATPGELTTS